MDIDEDLLRAYYETPAGKGDMRIDDIDLERMPSHISIIMDGNGRWAQQRGLDRTRGHVAGVDSLRETVTSCVRLGIDVLSVYAFSTENWRRPRYEVEALMHLFAKTLVHELPLFHQEGVRLRFLGDLDALPRKTRDVFEQGLEETASYDRMTFALAVNYGSRAELLRATRLIAQEVYAGSLAIDDVDENVLAGHLYTAGLPDPDLLIRTSGELRLSNYLLWQLAYAEMYVTDTLWPDFDRWELVRAIQAYQGRSRRFGGVASA